MINADIVSFVIIWNDHLGTFQILFECWLRLSVLDHFIGNIYCNFITNKLIYTRKVIKWFARFFSYAQSTVCHTPLCFFGLKMVLS